MRLCMKLCSDRNWGFVPTVQINYGIASTSRATITFWVLDSTLRNPHCPSRYLRRNTLIIMCACVVECPHGCRERSRTSSALNCIKCSGFSEKRMAVQHRGSFCSVSGAAVRVRVRVRGAAGIALLFVLGEYFNWMWLLGYFASVIYCLTMPRETGN